MYKMEVTKEEMMKKILLVILSILLLVTGCNEKTKQEYRLTVSADNNMGMVTKAPEKAVYLSGEYVSLTPQPKEGYVFDKWSGANGADVVSSTIRMTGNKNITAEFKKIQYTLSTHITPEGSVAVVVTPSKEAYDPGEEVTVSISNLEEGLEFGGWQEKGTYLTTGSTIIIKMNQNTELSGVVSAKKYKLNITADAGKGTVTKSPDNTDSIYYHGDEVKLTPSAINGYIFTGWGGANGAEVTTNKSIKMTGEKNITAIFESTIVKKQYSLTLAAINGSITAEPQKTQYEDGETVTLTVKPDAGYKFANWGGTDGSLVVGNKITITKNTEIEAIMAKNTYTLTIGTTTGGITAKSPDKGSYDYNDIVTLTSTPSSGYVFAGWEGINGADVTTAGTIIMDGNKELMPVFVKEDPKYTLTFVVTNGSIAVSPQKDKYSSGEIVTLTCTPDAGYVFKGWTGTDGNLVDGSNRIVMDGSKQVEAVIELKKTYTLTIGTTTGGIVVKNPDKSKYDENETVTLTAQPNTGYVFGSWGGTNGTEVTTTGTIKITGNKSITPSFIKKNILTLVVTNGSITASPAKDWYANGEVVTLTVTPKVGYQFTSWGGVSGGLVTSNKITINGDMSVEAVMSKIKYTLTIGTATGGTVTKSPNTATYDSGETVTLTVTPNADYEFKGWTGTNAGDINALKIVMSGNKTITPVFAKIITGEALTAKHEFNIEIGVSTLNEYTLYENTNNILQKEKNYTKYGALDNYDTYEYLNGALNYERHFTQADIKTSTIKSTYNADGSLLKEQEYDGADTLVRYYDYTYTGGIKTKRERYTAAGVKDRTWAYTYTNGKHTGTTEKDGTSILIESKVLEYTGENLTKETIKNGSGTTLNYYTYEYDVAVNLRTKNRFTVANVKDKYWKYYYGAEASTNSPPILPPSNDVWDTDADYEAVFADGILNEINIDMTQAEWNAFISDVSVNKSSDTFFKSKFTFTGKNGTVAMDNVGFRIRGNTTRVVPQQGASFYKAHFKLKFDETFAFAVGTTDYDKVDDRSFAKISALNLKATHIKADDKNDETRVTELYSYKMLNEAGLYTPKTAVTKLYININGVKHYFGVYNMIESIDKDFLTKRFGKASNNGNLYKCLWQQKGPATLESGTANNTSNTDTGGQFTYYLTTNKNPPNYSDIQAFITNINNKSGADLKVYLDANFNIDNFIKNLAMDMLIGNPDNYWSMGNNYYLYFNPNGKIEFVQYDYDNSLGNCWNPTNSAGKNTSNCDVYGYLDLLKDYAGANPVLADKVLAIPEYKALYKSYLTQYVNQSTGVFAYSKYLTYYNAMYSLIYSSLSNDTVGNMGSTMSKTVSEAYIAAKVASVNSQLDTTPVVTTYISDSMNVRGTNNGWGSTAMTYKGTGVWEATVTFGSGTDERFKFDRYANWNENYGDTNADFIAEKSGGDIFVAASSTYLISFDTATLKYTLTKQ